MKRQLEPLYSRLAAITYNQHMSPAVKQQESHDIMEQVDAIYERNLEELSSLHGHIDDLEQDVIWLEGSVTRLWEELLESSDAHSLVIEDVVRLEGIISELKYDLELMEDLEALGGS